MDSKETQSHEGRRVELATLEAHDADTTSADKTPSILEGAYANPGQNLPSIYRSAPDATIPANSDQDRTTPNEVHRQHGQQNQHVPTDDDLAPSTIAQWVPPAPLTHSDGTAPEVSPSSDPEKATSSLPETATSTIPEVVHSAKTANTQVSPASSDLEKEVDLEMGHPKSSSSSKTEVEKTEQAVPDPNIVGWDGPDDPHNPMNWSAKLKWSNVAVVSSVTFLT